MTHTITTPDASLPAWQRRLDAYNAGSGSAPITLDALLQLLHDEEITRLDSQLKTAQREALIPVADEILAAPADKQQAAITAALNAVRS
jgi:hypothetical protein